MTDPGALVTIVVTPREQFSKARRSLSSVLQNTDASVPLVYVDGNSPRAVARYLENQAAQRGFTLLRSDRYLGANEARNIGLAHVRTEYVAFVDNDVAVMPGWLDALLACARETGAWIVGPLYLIDEPSKQIVHMAGAELKIIDGPNGRQLHERHRFSNAALASVRDQLVRQPIDLVEFHCMLARTEVFHRLGPLDEGLLSFLDHVDFCIGVAGAGGAIYFEPAATVAHLAPPPCAVSDLPYYCLRWSDAWLEPSVVRFAQKHRLERSDTEFDGHRRFRDAHRLRLIRRLRSGLRRIAGGRILGLVDAFFNGMLFGRIVERLVVRPMERKRRAQVQTEIGASCTAGSLR